MLYAIRSCQHNDKKKGLDVSKRESAYIMKEERISDDGIRSFCCAPGMNMNDRVKDANPEDRKPQQDLDVPTCPKFIECLLTIVI